MHVCWGMKKSCSSKFVQLLLLNRGKARWSKRRAAQGFYYINSFSSNFFGPNSKTCTCKVRAAWGRVSRGLTVPQVGFFCGKMKIENGKTRFKRGHLQKLDLFIYRIVVSTNTCYYSENQLFVKRSHYIRAKKHKQSETYMCLHILTSVSYSK